MPIHYHPVAILMSLRKVVSSSRRMSKTTGLRSSQESEGIYSVAYRVPQQYSHKHALITVTSLAAELLLIEPHSGIVEKRQSLIVKGTMDSFLR